MKIKKRCPRITKDFATKLYNYMLKVQEEHEINIYEKENILGFMNQETMPNDFLIKTTWYLTINTEPLRFYMSGKTESIDLIYEKINFILEQEFKINELYKVSDLDFSKAISTASTTWNSSDYNLHQRYNYCFYKYFRQIVSLNQESKNATITFKTMEQNNFVSINLVVEQFFEKKSKVVFSNSMVCLKEDKKQLNLMKESLHLKIKEYGDKNLVLVDNANILNNK